MMRGFLSAASGVLAACAIALPVAASAETAAEAPDYADGANWLCLPERDDACAVDLDAAVIAADGTVTVEEFTRATDAKIDCFYVYPTVSLDEGSNSDMVAGPEEMSVIAAQFARFGSQCRTFAPLYRQVTLTHLRARMAQSSSTPTAARSGEEREFAYGDVKAAWEEYLAHHNDGRGVILIGHSQGSGMLKRLIAEEIETGAVLSQVIAAYLIGYNVEVPSGAAVGGDFTKMPLCSSAQQTGCLVTFATFAEGSVPAARTLFGRSYKDGVDVACVNPAAPGSEGPASLDAYFSNLPGEDEGGLWVEGEAITQRFVKVPGVVSAQCVDTSGAQFLSVAYNAEEPRKTPTLGSTGSIPALAPVWGLHTIDMHLGIGNLVALAGMQGEAYLDAQ
jgi:hypothetical protein